MRLRDFIPFFLFVALTTWQSCSISNFDKGYLVPAAQEPVEISFEEKKGLIVLEAEVNGVKGHFLFDNGFSLSGVNEDFAKKAQIKFTKKSTIKDANNSTSSLAKGTVKEVKIQEQTFVNTGFYKIDTKKFFPCTPIDGIIGASIINKINWEIDFETKKMLLSSTPFKNEGNRLNIGISNNNSSFVNLTIRGKTIKSKIDFGKNGGLEFRYVEMKNVLKNEKAIKKIGIKSLSANGLGKIDTTYQLVNRYQIQNDKKALPVSGKLSLVGQLKYQGYVGIEFFKDYKVTINSIEKHYVLEEQDKQLKDTIKATYGFVIYPIEKKWKIIRLTENTLISKQCQLMKEVVALDNQPMSDFDSICELKTYLKQKQTEKTSILLQLKGKSAAIEIPYEVPIWSVL